MKKKENIGIVILCVWMALVVGAAVFAPLFAPNDPNATNLSAVQQGASAQYPLGTDMLGRCMLSRVLYGARVSVLTGLGVTLTVFAAGVAAGTLCGYCGGVVDAVLNKIITMMQAFPKIILAIAIVGVLGIGIRNTVLALILVLWVDYARLSRSLASSVRNRTFIRVARVCGESEFHILFFRVLPNILGPLAVQASLGIASTMMEVAALSYLGLGVAEPTAEWGAMINSGRAYIQTDPKLVLIPGAAIFLTAAVFHLFGEKLRDRLQS